MQTRNLEGIQALRAFAALAVAYHHVANFLLPLEAPGLCIWTDMFDPVVGAAGVDVFFVISGFIMAYSTQGSGTAAGSFLYRRATRIFPLYWFWSLIALALCFVAPWTGVVHGGPWELAKSFLLYPTVNELNLLRPVILAQGWTLTFELFFYAVFAACLWLPSRNRAAVATGILLALQLLGYLLPGDGAELRVLREEALLEFCVGLWIAHALQQRGVSLTRNQMLVGIGLAFAAFLPTMYFDEISSQWHRLLRFGTASSLLVGSVALFDGRLPLRVPRPVTLLGDASYSIYLTHVIVIRLGDTSKSFVAFSTYHPNLGFAFLLLCIVVVGVASYVFVEKPLTKLFKPKRLPSPPRSKKTPRELDVGALAR